jgi:hypothetical protein
MTAEYAVTLIFGDIAIGAITIFLLSFFWLLFLVIYDKKKLWHNFAVITGIEVILLICYVMYETYRYVNIMARM